MLVDYFRKNLAKGYNAETLKWALINQGYSKTIIELSLEKAQKEMIELAPEIQEKPHISYEIIDETNKPVTIKKSWWRRIFGK